MGDDNTYGLEALESLLKDAKMLAKVNERGARSSDPLKETIGKNRASAYNEMARLIEYEIVNLRRRMKRGSLVAGMLGPKTYRETVSIVKKQLEKHKLRPQVPLLNFIEKEAKSGKGVREILGIFGIRVLIAGELKMDRNFVASELLKAAKDVSGLNRLQSPNSPENAIPLSNKEEENAWDAGYEAASYFLSNGERIDDNDFFLWVMKNDCRVPRMREDHPQFFEYYHVITEAAQAFNKSNRRSRRTAAVNVKREMKNLEKLLHDANDVFARLLDKRELEDVSEKVDRAKLQSVWNVVTRAAQDVRMMKVK